MLFNVGCVRKNPDDHMSVDIWVDELNSMGTDSPVILYKQQGAAPTDETGGMAACDFILCLQTIMQRQFMLQFGNGNMLCLDSTHGTNQYDFNLVTMMVVDDFGEGSPVAFMICNREDEVALTAFFKAIKARLPSNVPFRASHVISDDAGQYYRAWCAVFGPAEKKLCTWHVDKNWRKAIREHVRGEEDQIEIYHMLRSIVQELDKTDFSICLQSFVNYIEQNAPNFAAYFRPYCARANEWAYCHRIGILK